MACSPPPPIYYSPNSISKLLLKNKTEKERNESFFEPSERVKHHGRLGLDELVCSWWRVLMCNQEHEECVLKNRKEPRKRTAATFIWGGDEQVWQSPRTTSERAGSAARTSLDGTAATLEMKERHLRTYILTGLFAGFLMINATAETGVGGLFLSHSVSPP